MPCIFTFADGSLFIPDTYTTATHSVDTEVTEFPVEDGASISDHVIVKPQMLSLDMIVSPWSPEPGLLYPPEGDDRPLLAWNLLSSQARRRQTFTVVVDGQTYAPCVFSGQLGRTHVYDDGLSYKITCQVKQILIATAQTVPAAQVARGIRHKSGKKDNGATQAQIANAQVQALAKGQIAQYQVAAALGFGDVFQ